MTENSSSPVGFVGIGAMGLPMARRLVGAGLHVHALDPNPRQVRIASSSGISASTDPMSLDQCPVIIVLVAKGQDLLSLLDGPLFAPPSRVELVIVMSTVGVDDVRHFSRELRKPGTAVIDCPVTGGVVGAESGKLAMFAAGAEQDVRSVLPLLEHFGHVEVCGTEPGDGQAFKLVNQLLAATNLVVAAEALAFARALGLDATRALELVSSGAGGSWMLRDRGPRMLDSAENRAVKTHLNILAKDVELVRRSARAVSFPGLMTESASEVYATAIAEGWGERDDSSLIDLYPAAPQPSEDSVPEFPGSRRDP